MSKTIRPRCGDCIHLLEITDDQYGSLLFCKKPQGNRKSIRDVGGCDLFEAKEK